MDIGILLIVVIASLIIAFLWQFFYYLCPAYKRVKIANALAVLAECLTQLDKNALSNSKILQGHYLHDRLYKILFHVLIHKTNLKFRMLTHIKFNETSKKEMQKFITELKTLDGPTRKIVKKAIYSMGKIFFLRSPFIFLMISIKMRQEELSYKKQRLRQRLH